MIALRVLVLLCFQPNTTYRYAEILLFAYLHFAGTIGPYQAQGIQNLICNGILYMYVYV